MIEVVWGKFDQNYPPRTRKPSGIPVVVSEGEISRADMSNALSTQLVSYIFNLAGVTGDCAVDASGVSEVFEAAKNAFSESRTNDIERYLVGKITLRGAAIAALLEKEDMEDRLMGSLSEGDQEELFRQLVICNYKMGVLMAAASINEGSGPGVA